MFYFVAMRKLSLLIFALPLLTCLSCSLSNDPAYDSLVSRLKNRGPLTLSPDNPYIASNLLISKEINANPELRGFIDHKGIPNIIEVNKDYFKSLKYKFFYPNEQQFYNLELVNNTWVINGPEAINATQAQQIYYLTGGNIISPKVILDEKPENDISYKQSNNQLNDIAEDILPKFSEQNNNAFNENISDVSKINNKASIEAETKKQDSIVNTNKGVRYQGAIQPNVKNTSKPTTIAKNNNNINNQTTNINSNKLIALDKIIQSTSTYTAELNYQGDLVHFVTYKGETLPLISAWYTKDPNNADKISRINSKKSTDTLLVGDKIIIPSYLLKNKNKLTQKALVDISNLYTSPNNLGNGQPQQSLPKNNINSNGLDTSELEFF